MKVLLLLGALPSREAGSAKIEKAAYYIALDGVSTFGLTRAMEAILQGKHGHTFFPSPAELRMQCDKAMEPIIAAHQKATRERLQREQAAEFKPVVHTQAEIVRVNEIYHKFCAGYVTDFKTEDQLIAEIRAKYDPDMLDAVPDAPTQFNRPRSAA